MHRRTLATLAFAGTFAAGCGTGTGTTLPDDRPPDLPPSVTTTGTTTEVRLSNPDRGVTQEVAASPDQVWQALIQTYDDFDFEPDGIDTRGRQLAVERLTRSQIAGEPAADLARCANSGAGPSAASRFRITFAFVSRVIPDGNGSILNTRVQASATPIDGSSIGRVGCVSTGVLEQRILGAVALKLGLARPGRK